MNNFKTILICDDEENILEVMRIILEEENYKVYTCNREKDIQTYVAKYKPDLLFLDIWMSTKNIVKIIEELKEKFKDELAPIILISALNNIKQISIEANANDYLPKPFTIEELLEKVNKFIQK
jgi:DNA-binding response OmpR family regulator